MRRLIAYVLVAAAMVATAAAEDRAGQESVKQERPGCEGIATLIYDQCLVAHVYACADNPDDRTLAYYSDHAQSHVVRLEAGLDMMSLEIRSLGFEQTVRRLSGPSAAALIAQPQVAREVTRRFETRATSRGLDTPYVATTTTRLRELSPISEPLRDGPEPLRRFALTFEHEPASEGGATDPRVSGTLFFAPDLGVVIGETSLDEEGVETTRTPIAILRPGADAFLTAHAAIGCRE